jgi:hypothetical protein
MLAEVSVFFWEDHLVRLAFFALLMVGLSCSLNAQDDSVPKSPSKKPDDLDASEVQSKAWQARRTEEFAAHRVGQVTAGGQVRLQFEKVSLLNWSNPIRSSPAGAVFIWTADSRPQLIASTYPYPDGIEQELSSLSEDPLILNEGDPKEHRFTPGIQWMDVPNAEAPHRQRSLRLVQMRRIAEQFRVFGKGNEPFEARLLSQPIFRVPAESPVENAVFAFVQGTDPEAVLLIESKEASGWRYALGRMTTIAITAEFNKEKVWDVPWFSSSYKSEQPFHKIQLPGAK